MRRDGSSDRAVFVSVFFALAASCLVPLARTIMIRRQTSRTIATITEIAAVSGMGTAVVLDIRVLPNPRPQFRVSDLGAQPQTPFIIHHGRSMRDFVRRGGAIVRKAKTFQRRTSRYGLGLLRKTSGQQDGEVLYPTSDSLLIYKEF
jgi:hypothetical protein